ncbi:MAG: hypothetical protein CMN02_04160 [Roseibacillus sp.]|nr:hypothetical protein [Roseibacillus sp.]|tara:strand:+ start:617 stop:847 length:231 start_codon:yes stop_codon:yes gene_type:complete
MVLTGVIFLPILPLIEKKDGVGRAGEVRTEPQEQRLRAIPSVDDPLQDLMKCLIASRDAIEPASVFCLFSSGQEKG